jgi:hypothetical protein
MHIARLLMPIAMAAGAGVALGRPTRCLPVTRSSSRGTPWDTTCSGTTRRTGIASIGDGSVGFTSGDSTRVFTARGTYSYHCGIHGPAMSGVVVVQ